MCSGPFHLVNAPLVDCNPECTKYIPAYNAHEGKRQYKEIGICLTVNLVNVVEHTIRRSNVQAG